MISHTLKTLPKQAAEVTVTISKDEIGKEYDLAFARLLADLSVEGFRKGKVPAEIGKKHIQSEAVYQRVIRDLLPRIYADIIEKEHLKPIVSPKVDLVKAKEGEDWEVKITVAQKPAVELKNFKEVVKQAKSETKKADIWVPGKDKEASKPETNSQELLNAVLGALLKEVKIEFADIVIEQEEERRLSKLVDDIQRLGLSVESYLKSKNLTMEELKSQLKREIEETYKIEFLLSEIADLEKIEVGQEELDKLFTNLKTDEEKKQARENAYFYASILRKQKTLDYLMSL